MITQIVEYASGAVKWRCEHPSHGPFAHLGSGKNMSEAFEKFTIHCDTHTQGD